MESAAHYAAVQRLIRRHRWSWQGRWIEVNGRPVHFVEQGQGPPVVLLHGFGGWSFCWRKNLQALAASGYRAIAPDLLGHGFSDKSAPDQVTLAGQVDLLRHLLPALGATPAVVVGNSMGGEIALRLALQAPDLVRAIAIANSTGHDRIEIPAQVLRWLRLPGAGLAAWALVHSRRFIGGRFVIPCYGDRSRLEPGTIEGYCLPFRLPGVARLFLQWLPRLDFGREAGNYGCVRQPVLILWGEADPWWPVDDARRFAAAMPQARLVTYPGAGHLPQEEVPEAFNRDLLAFLAEVPGYGTRLRMTTSHSPGPTVSTASTSSPYIAAERGTLREEGS